MTHHATADELAGPNSAVAGLSASGVGCNFYLIRRDFPHNFVCWDLRIQSAITTGDSEPEPDIAVVRGDETMYDRKHPEPADIGAVIEVSASTLNANRLEMGRIYARSGIAYYWIVNLIEGWIEVYCDPDRSATPSVYRTRTDFGRADNVPVVLDGQTVATVPVADLLP